MRRPALRGREVLAQGTLYPDVIESTTRPPPRSRAPQPHPVSGGRATASTFKPLRRSSRTFRRPSAQLGLPDHVSCIAAVPGSRARRSHHRRDHHEARGSCALPTRSSEKRSARGTNRPRGGHTRRAAQHPLGWRHRRRAHLRAPHHRRTVSSADTMTATGAPPHELLAKMSHRIINEVAGINRVAYRRTSKRSRHQSSRK